MSRQPHYYQLQVFKFSCQILAGSSFNVKHYDSRPSIVVIPPRSASSKPMTMTFMKAVTTLPSALSEENLIHIFSIIGQNERGNLRKLFVILNDDSHDECLEMVKKYHEGRRRTGGGSSSNPGASMGLSGTVSGSGAGMEVSASLVKSLRQPPPPPPPPSSSICSRQSLEKGSSSKSKDHDDHVGDGGLKRRRQSSSSRSPSPRRTRRSPSSSESSSGSSSSSSSSGSSSSGGRGHRHKDKKRSKNRRHQGKSKGKGKSKSKAKATKSRK